MNKYENKTVYFVGDSNLVKPYFLEYLRADMVHTGKKVYLYNKSIPGARMDMVMNSIDEEIAILTPDCVALCFGINDLGIWLYDAFKSLTDEIIKERENRIVRYCTALETVIIYLKSKNIRPILMTPLYGNENITEQEGIKTETDNKEKSVITDTLFTKATFKNINDNGIAILREKGIKIASDYGVEVWDLSSAVKKRADIDCFYGDGVHYNEKGHKLIAETIYESMFGEKMEYYPIDERIKALSYAEADERAYFFVKYNLVFLSYGKKENEALINIVKQIINEKGYKEGLTKDRADGFFRFIVDRTGNTERINKTVMRLF